jgi:hypothetical protein
VRTPRFVYTKWFATLSLFIGGSALVTWVGLPVWRLFSPKPGSVIRLLVESTRAQPYMPILAAAGLWWGLRILRGKPGSTKHLVAALAPVVLLSPLLAVFGWISSFMLQACFVNHVLPDKVQQSTASPDGRHVAYIVRRMTVGGAGQAFRVSIDGGRKITVGGTGDYNFARKIHWSPDSEIVVFQQHSDLVAANMTTREVHSSRLAYEISPDRTIDVHAVDSIEFPNPGVFVITYKDGTTSQTVDLASRERWNRSRE